MTTKPLKKGATYDDLRDVPDHFVAEMFDGDLYASPRPALPHANAAGSLFAEIHKSFHRKSPGGWVILFEPELHFGSDVLVPDLAGWRRARLPNVKCYRRPPKRSTVARSCGSTLAKAWRMRGS